MEAALETVGLGAIGHLPFGYLSTGQRRRAAIARLLVSRRPVWLLDEPTAGLDAESERQFAVLMEKHLGGGGMIVAATHVALGIDGAGELRMGEAGAGVTLPLAGRVNSRSGAGWGWFGIERFVSTPTRLTPFAILPARGRVRWAPSSSASFASPRAREAGR